MHLMVKKTTERFNFNLLDSHISGGAAPQTVKLCVFKHYNTTLTALRYVTLGVLF